MLLNIIVLGFPGGMLVVKNLPANAGDTRAVVSIPGSGRFFGGGHGNPLKHYCLENPMDRGAWWAAVHRVAKSWAWLKWLSTIIILWFIHIVVGINNSLFIAENHFIVWMYQSLCIHLSLWGHLDCFQFSAIKRKLLWISAYQSLYEYMVSFLLGKYLGVECIGHMARICLNFLGADSFLKCLYHITFPSGLCEFQFLYILATLDMANILTFLTILRGM